MRTSPPRPGERLRRLTADAILQASADAPDQVLALTAIGLNRWVTTRGELPHAFVIADGGVRRGTRPGTRPAVNRVEEGWGFPTPIEYEALGHFCEFWTDGNRVSHGRCDCRSGWAQNSTNGPWLMDAWRTHVHSIHYKAVSA